MPRWSLPVLMLGVAALAVWFLLPPAGDAESPDAGIPRPASGTALEAAGGAGPRPERDDRPEPDPEPVVAAPFSEPAAAETEPSAGGPKLRIVEAGNGAAVPGAVVHVVDLSAATPAAFAEFFEMRPDPAETIARRGLRRTADQNGDVVLPAGLAAILATAEAPGLFGLAGFGDLDAAPLKLEVRPDRDLRIQVVGQDGRPRAGVPVMLANRNRPNEAPAWTGTSAGPDGEAVLRHFPWFARDAAPSEEAFAVRFRFPLADAPEVPVRADTAGDAPVRMVLPACGSLVVRVAGVDGGPAPEDAWATVDAGGAGGTAQGPASAPRARVVSGEARFPCIGLGLRLHVTAATFGHGLRPVAVIVPGPAAEGEEVVLDLAFGREHAAVAGRAVTIDGAPLARHRINASLAGLPEGKLPLNSAITADDGAFRFVIAAEGDGTLTPPPGARLVLTAAPAPRKFPDANGPRAEVPLLSALGPGENAVGDVVFAAPPVVAAGVVMDEAGEPVPRVALGVERLQKRNPKDAWPTWPRLWNLGARTGKDGRFEIRGSCDAAEIRIVAEADGWYESERAAFAPGADDRRITLRRAGALEGGVLLPPGLPAARVHVTVAGEPAATFRSWPRSGDPRDAEVTQALDREARFRFPRLRPGTGNVHVKIGWSGEPLVTIPGVVVPADGSGGDPRIQGIDLREIVNVITLTVLDESGHPVEGAEVEVSGSQPGGTTGNEVSPANGKVLIVTPLPAVDVVVRARGHRDTVVEAVAGDRVVVLPAALSVRLFLTGDWPEPEPPWTLSVALLPAGAREARTPGRKVRQIPPEELGPLREVRLSVPAPGPHRVAVTLQRKTDGRPRTHTLQGLESEVIDVFDTPADQVYQVHVPEARMLAAYDALR